MIAVGFVARATGEGASIGPFAVSPDLARRHLSCAAVGACEAVLMGRLYHRHDRLAWLRARLSPADYDQCRSSDAALGAAVYRHGGAEALGDLEGDFVLVVYDRLERRLVALRDPLGAYPLFWSSSHDALVVATSIRALAGERPRVDVDEEFVADYLALPTDAIAELPTERTAYRGVHRLRPGWILTSRAPSGRVEHRPCWDWASRGAGLRVDTAADAAALVRERLDAAVAERMSPARRTACHFSGGTDSTAVALLAEQHVPGAGRGVVALTLAWAGETGLAREGADAVAAAAGRARVEHRRIPADDFLEFDGHDRIPPLDEPSPTVVDLRASEALAEAARTAGADTILSGHGGDHLFHHPAPVLAAGLLRAGRVPAALALARAHAASRTGSAWEIVREAVRFLLPVPLRSGPGAWLAGGRARFATMTPLQVPPWFTREFVRETAQRDRTMRYRAPRFDGHPFGASDVETIAGDWHHWHVAVPRGLVEARPFFDTRLVAAALALPARLHAAPHPMKPVLSAALAGVVPPQILGRARKANFNATLAGFGRHQSWLEDLIRRSPVDDRIMDRRVLAACVDDVTLGIFRDAPSVGRLRMTLTFLMWLSQRDAWARQTLPPVLDGASFTASVHPLP